MGYRAVKVIGVALMVGISGGCSVDPIIKSRHQFCFVEQGQAVEGTVSRLQAHGNGRDTRHNDWVLNGVRHVSRSFLPRCTKIAKSGYPFNRVVCVL